MTQKKCFATFFLATIFFSTHLFSSEKLFDVVISSPSSDKRAIAFVDTVTHKNRIVEVNMSGEVVWEWDLPQALDSGLKRDICQGADIEYLEGEDKFLFLIPRLGAYIVNREGNYKTVVSDNEISHDIDPLPNGNFIYVRARVAKGEDEVREISPTGQVVWKWSHAEHFPNRDDFLKYVPEMVLDRWKKRPIALTNDGTDWAHVNGVERYPNGDTLVSLRNFLMFSIVDPQGNPIKTYEDIWLVHEPHKTDYGYIAADRFSGGGKARFSIVKIWENGLRANLLTGQFAAVRGIEKLPNGRYNITSVGNVFEIDDEGNILQRMHLSIQNEDAEKDLGQGKRPADIFDEGKCRPINLYKVVKTKEYYDPNLILKETFNSFEKNVRKAIQAELRKFGYSSTIDGIWGSGTLSAINQYIKEKEFADNFDPKIALQKLIGN